MSTSAVQKEELRKQIAEQAARNDAPNKELLTKALREGVDLESIPGVNIEIPKDLTANDHDSDEDDQEQGTSEKATAKKKSPRRSKGKAQQLSVSVHPEDLSKIDEIAEALREKGIRRVNDSAIIKIALAALNPNNRQLAQLYREVKGRDGRVKLEDSVH